VSAFTAGAEAPGEAVQRVALNAAALLGAYVLPRSLTFAAALVAARVLRPAAFGVYGTAAALAMTLSILCTLGMRGSARPTGSSWSRPRRCS
jgi:O-antigen/teichoic acid export membrane protein